MRARAQHVLESIVVNGPGTFTADLAAAGFHSVVTGDQIVATVTDADGNTSNFSQAAYVDQPERTTHTVQHEDFGSAVDVDGNRMVVGAPSADVLDGSLFAEAGAVYVYERPAADAQWRLTARLVSPDPFDGMNFGRSVAAPR